MEEKNANQSVTTNIDSDISQSTQNTPKLKTKHTKKYIFMFIVLILAILLPVYLFKSNIRKTENIKPIVVQVFNLSNINISSYKNLYKTDIVYAKTIDGGFKDYISLNLATGNKTVLFNNKQLVNQDQIHFSPNKNYIISYKNMASGQPYPSSSTTTLTLYDINFSNPKIIYKHFAPSSDTEEMLEPGDNFISNSGNKILIFSRKPIWESITDTPKNIINVNTNSGNLKKGNNSSMYLTGYAYKTYLIDLDSKNYKILEDDFFKDFNENPIVVGWSKDENEVIVNYGFILRQYNLKTSKKVSERLDDRVMSDTFLYNDVVGNIAYNLLNTPNYGASNLVIKNINTGKSVIVDKSKADINFIRNFIPLKWSVNGKELLFKRVDVIDSVVGKIAKHNASYVVYNLDKNTLLDVNRPEEFIAAQNKDKYGIAWYTACLNRLNFISLNGKIVDSVPVGNPSGCGSDLTPIIPSLITTDNQF